MPRIRTGYSFKFAFGHLEDVANRLAEIGWPRQPISDTCSTFGFSRWNALVPAPMFGVELAVTPDLETKDRPAIDNWTFFAYDSLVPLHDLIGLATSQVISIGAGVGKIPTLSYQQAQSASGVIKIAGHRAQLTAMDPKTKGLYIALAPSIPRQLYKAASQQKFKFIASSDNNFPRAEDFEAYRMALWRSANRQTYPQHILSDQEWLAAMSWCSSKDLKAAMTARNFAFNSCKAQLSKATLFTPPKPKHLRDMCIDGAARKDVDLTDAVYAERLEREIKMIYDKKFEDYFYILAEIIAWAKQHMIVGPARGSSCGSLVCYLLDITTVDPILFDLIFERFIDVNRSDLPDIDVDVSDAQRHRVFEHIELTYGKEHAARLGTVGMFRPRSALNAAGMALRIPMWRIEKVSESIIVRSTGDSRALQQLEDTLKDTEAGRALAHDYPAIALAARLEGHPSNASQHAAGIVITAEPINRYVAIDNRSASAMCDKKDAEKLNLLKIDMLGLTQLSIFERTLKLAGLDFHGFLEKIPLNDPAAFTVLNKRLYSGIFQFNGMALQSLAKQIEVKKLEDIIAITALARPGPMASGGANRWVKRHTEREPVTYPHPIFEPYLKDTLGIVIYQEQVMQIGREIGDLSWGDVTELRKSMARSLGKEYFDRYGDRWKVGAIKKGVPPEVAEQIWSDLCLSGDTKILNPFPAKGSYRYLTLRDIYKRGGLGPSEKGANGKRQKFLMWDGTTIKPHENYGVSYMGKKQTYTIETESGNVIHATAEHKFLMPDGGYRTLKDLQQGDYVMSMGQTLPTERKLKKGTGRGGHNWWFKLKNDEPNYAANKAYFKKTMNRCQRCKKAPYQETHHINFDHTDHRIENLMPICRKCHKELHSIKSGYPRPWQKGRTIYEDRILSINPRKIEDVYDVHMPAPHHNFIAENIVVHNCAYGSWSFNKQHSVAYGLVSYYCLWFKAHYPVEFAAATLDAEALPSRQINILRELVSMGIDYVPVDIDHSDLQWSIKRQDDKSILVGPLTSIDGIGLRKAEEIIKARCEGKPIRNSILQRLENPVTRIDSIYPVGDALKRLWPDLTAAKIYTRPTSIIDVQCGATMGEVVIIGVATKIAPKDENEEVNVAKRGGMRFTGPTQALNLFIKDDTDEIFCKVNRFHFERLGRNIVEHGRAGQSIYAIKGDCPPDFRMIRVRNIRYLGEMATDLEQGGSYINDSANAE